MTWKVPENAPAVVGLKDTVGWQLVVSARVMPQSPALAMKPELAVNLRFVRLAPRPVAVIVTGIEELVVLTACELNVIGACIALTPVVEMLRFKIGS